VAAPIPPTSSGTLVEAIRSELGRAIAVDVYYVEGRPLDSAGSLPSTSTSTSTSTTAVPTRNR
jgi:hypothetical protein